MRVNNLLEVKERKVVEIGIIHELRTNITSIVPTYGSLHDVVIQQNLFSILNTESISISLSS